MSKRRLSVVSPDEQLVGKAPATWERLARSCSVESKDHVALVQLALTIAQRAARSCVPPSVAGALLEAVQSGHSWVNAVRASRDETQRRSVDLAESDAQAARIGVFQAVSAIEEATSAAVAGANEHLGAVIATPLAGHAAHVVDRYVRLAAHFAASAVCHALDAITKPEIALDVFEDCRGARAYQAAGLGAARHPAFIQAAVNQAEWEAARSRSASSEALKQHLAVQIFHEYLGGRYRMHADAEAAAQAAFAAWALQGRS